jgi:hypothetical protein
MPAIGKILCKGVFQRSVAHFGVTLDGTCAKSDSCMGHHESFIGYKFQQNLLVSFRDISMCPKYSYPHVSEINRATPIYLLRIDKYLTHEHIYEVE